MYLSPTSLINSRVFTEIVERTDQMTSDLSHHQISVTPIPQFLGFRVLLPLEPYLDLHVKRVGGSRYWDLPSLLRGK